MKTGRLEPMNEIDLQSKLQSASNNFKYKIDNVPHKHDQSDVSNAPFLKHVVLTASAPLCAAVTNTSSGGGSIDFEATTGNLGVIATDRQLGLAYNSSHFVITNGILNINPSFF
jgi:hypothetical protein